MVATSTESVIAARRTPGNQMPEKILVVDDDAVQRQLLTAGIERLGYVAIAVDSGEAALQHLSTPEGETVALVILDLVMPGIDGMTVLSKLREKERATPVIVQTVRSDTETVVSAMRAGATDYIAKPVSPERLQVSIENALKRGALEGEIARMRHAMTGTLTFRDIITCSAPMEQVIGLGERSATSHIPILIEGESGVGKELLARAIQGSGDRRSKPFMTVNCGAISESLVESTLFGHEKGAFAGANENHVGKFREAHGGTLFLDEVGALPAEVQVKLLRALQDGEIEPVGASGPIRVDFRLISSSNQNLIDLVKAGSFREDLYYRLNAFPIRVPPLRERREDISELARHFCTRFAAEEGKTFVRKIGTPAMHLLSIYNWPGNVRQLRNAVFRAVVLADGPVLGVEEFPQIAAQVVAQEKQGRDGQAQDSFAQNAQNTSQELPAFDKFGDIRTVSDIEAELIRIALMRYRGRMSLVARKLGIGRSTLYRKLKELGISDTVSGIAAE